MSVEFRFLELEHYDNEPHFARFAKVREAREREATVLLPKGVSAAVMFGAFLERVLGAIPRRLYLPIVRFCDGEYSFYSGTATTTCWGERESSLKGAEELHVEALRLISREGLMCPNLNLVYLKVQSDFLEFLRRNVEPLRNYVPFYFVYALLAHPRFLEALRGLDVALVTSFSNKNLGNILDFFRALEVLDVQLVEIPSSGVAHGNFNLALARRPDVAFVGAGIGAPLVLARLAAHGCLAIDSGFAFHLWDGTYDRHERLFLNYVP